MDRRRRLWHTPGKTEQSGIMDIQPSAPERPRGLRRARWRTMGLATGAGTALVLVVMVTGIGNTPTREAAAVEALTAVPPQAPAAEAGAERRYVQQLGTSCRTATKVCPLPAAMPIGAPCSCDGEPGEVAP
jgi:hypothetical protein